MGEGSLMSELLNVSCDHYRGTVWDLADQLYPGSRKETFKEPALLSVGETVAMEGSLKTMLMRN